MIILQHNSEHKSILSFSLEYWEKNRRKIGKYKDKSKNVHYIVNIIQVFTRISTGSEQRYSMPYWPQSELSLACYLGNSQDFLWV